MHRTPTTPHPPPLLLDVSPYLRPAAALQTSPVQPAESLLLFGGPFACRGGARFDASTGG